MSEQTQRVLIAGCGYVGTRLAEFLAKDGAEVFALRRSDVAMPAGVTGVCADLGNIASLGAVPDGLTSIVYCAGASRSDEEAYRKAYIDGPENLIRALRERAELPRNFLFCSSTAVYGQARGEWVDEESPTLPSRWNGELLLTAERLVHASLTSSVVVRLGGIYGPGRTRLVEQVRRGEARIPLQEHFTNRIHRDDAAGMLAHLLKAEPKERCYLGVDDEPASLADVLRHLARRLNVEEPPLAEPGAPSQRRAGSKRCRNARLRAEGYSFRYPSFREGYAEVARPA